MNFGIGLSGLNVAQRAIEIVGTNIANVSTEGYHRQEMILAPVTTEAIRGVPIGGVRVANYQRAVDTLLENEIRRQQPQQGQVAQELVTLQALQGTFGTLDSEGLGWALEQFFGAVRELSAEPMSQPLREQAVWAADNLAGNFRHLGGAVEELENQVYIEARNTVERANALAEEIAELNAEIQLVETRGGNPNLVLDQRDQAILELADLADVTILRGQDGSSIVNVYAWGTPLVLNDQATTLRVSQLEGMRLGLAFGDSSSYDAEIRGGQLGGLFALRNDLLAGVQSSLDDLAATLIREINRIHVQGVGTAGAFDELTGSRVDDTGAAIETWSGDVSAGRFHLRLIAPDGGVTCHSVYVDPAADTLETVAAKLNALDAAHLTASLVDGRLHLEGLGGYEFDFLPVARVAVGTAWTGSSTATESGTYSGTLDETYSFTVQGDGTVGATAGLAVEVRNRAGAVVATLDVGDTYVPDTPLAVEEGLSVAFAAGTLTDGEQFTVQATAEPVPQFLMSAAWNGTSSPAVSGIYDGPANDTFTFTVQGGGEVGVTDGLAVEVRNAAGQHVTSLDVGGGYAAGDRIEVYQGLYVAFETGTLADGEQFQVEALAESDPSGFLAAAGMGSLLGGTRAANMAVRQEVLDDPRLLATAQGAEMVDNLAARKIARLAEEPFADLGGATPAEAFRLVVADVGQKVVIRQARHDALQNVMQQMENQRDALSGVDINDEAAKLLLFEKMFQAMAKVLSTQHEAMQTLIDLL